MDEHFVITERVAFALGDSLAVRRGIVSGKLLGINITHEGGFAMALPGYVATERPLDERCKLPISISGVQLWRGWNA